MNLLFVLTVTSFALLSANGARILSLFPHQAKSHYVVFEPLLKKLSEKGHQVVSVTHFPQKKPLANFTDVNITNSLPSLVGTKVFMSAARISKWARLKGLLNFGVPTCDPVLNHPALKKILQSKEKFDVFIVELFASDCFLGIAHALDIPIVIGAISSVNLPWSNDILRNPENPSYVPNWFSDRTDQMDLFERSVNFLDFFFNRLAFRYLSDKPSHEVAKIHFGVDLPDFDAIRSRISLILTNAHPAVSTPRPLAAGLKQLGGIHIPSSGPAALPKDLEDFLDSQGKNGVIYFSLGSQIDPSTMPKQALAAFYRAFEQVPQQILWKCSGGKMPTLPKNVKCIEWAPQLSILCPDSAIKWTTKTGEVFIKLGDTVPIVITGIPKRHPNVRLFITHGGMLGSQEAVYCGVPILGIPLFGDQHLNMAYFVKKGLAVKLDYRQLSYEPVSNALNELLVNKSYIDMARKVSAEFRDRLVPPLEEGVYWVEYLIRHGANSLKTAATDLTWYQYLLLDLLAWYCMPKIIPWETIPITRSHHVEVATHRDPTYALVAQPAGAICINQIP
ncbi:UDP-glucuronosyltransferase 2C1 [Eufriesea mexicana]|uniref:UDP-glucuronosyltransferase 2C1 n=1 Tax=Eufriesea mexicana TaxID=516756 RepID=A0A310S8D6_9HYME|nr:UDP-glucuronosyltransferase 2C1 [Eufriesea mexicana]